GARVGAVWRQSVLASGAANSILAIADDATVLVAPKGRRRGAAFWLATEGGVILDRSSSRAVTERLRDEPKGSARRLRSSAGDPTARARPSSTRAGRRRRTGSGRERRGGGLN